MENILKWRRNPRWWIFDFLFSKNCQKSTNKVFFILLKDLCSKIFIFNGKNNVHRVRSKMAAKNQDGGFYFIFLQKFNSNAIYHASLKSFFDANQLTIKCCIWKSWFEIFEFDKMAAKSKMATKINIFVFLLSKLQFVSDFKNIFWFQSVRSFSNFHGRFFFQKSKNLSICIFVYRLS